MGDVEVVDRNRPTEFHGFVTAPEHRLFAVFDGPDTGEQALTAIQAEGLIEDDQPWVFYGEEGSRRLDSLGTQHGVHGRAMRTVQSMLSDDRRYLRMLDQGLRDGCLIIAVHVHNAAAADRVAQRLRELSGHTFAFGAHLDFVPLSGGHIW